MTDNTKKAAYPKLNYDEYARTVPPDDLWGQVKRTIAGKPVDREQIQMIIQRIQEALALTSNAVLLDLGCGNGALSELLFTSCQAFLGVDISEYLISVARKNFERLPHYAFMAQGAAEYVRNEPHPLRFTKALCYGTFAYFSAEECIEILHLLFHKFTQIDRFFIGNLPDKSRAAAFYSARSPSPEELTDPHSQIGIWRTPEEFAGIAQAAGWKMHCSTMPAGFFSAHYRYDALLYR